MSFSKYLVGLAVAVTLTACGGGGGSPGTVRGEQAPAATAPLPVASTPVTVATPSSVEVLTSGSALPSSGGDVLITAFVKNAANVGMPGQAVAFSASSGTLQGPAVVTDAQGAATAKLITGGDKSSRDIRVTVAAGAASGSVVVQVSGTRVSISGSGSLQAGGAAAQYVLRAADSSGNGIGGAVITVVSSLGNAIGGGPLATDSTGSATFLYTPNNAGTDTLTVSGLGNSATATVLVNAIDFVAISPASNATIAISASQVVQVRYRNLGAGVSGQTVSFSTTRGSFAVATATTDASGLASATLSSTTAGPAMIVAQIAGIGAVNLPVQFVATAPTSIVVQANPGGVLPNATGTTLNQSSIEAVVRDANGNAVANRQVNFSTLVDLSNGTLSPGSATTDANGRAQVQFIPGASSTPSNGVIIQAEVASTTINAATSLTVNGQALFITLGFGNTISNVDETTYSKDFSVYVTDANGVAVGNQQITLSVIPTDYSKGALSRPPGATTWAYTATPTKCINEDINLNGILDGGEDTNLNGQLTPGNIVVAAPGSVVTNSSGRATFAIQYGEQFAPWATVSITARATVAGTESRRTISYALGGLAADFTAETPPAGVVSPFGTSTLCTNSN